MASEAASLFVSVDARISGLERGLMRAQSQLSGAQRKMGKDADLIEHKLGRMGKRMAKGAAIGGAEIAVLGVAGAIGYAVKKAADFESQLDSLGSVTKASGRDMARLKKQAMDAGAATKFSALDAAKAQTELAKGGLTASKILGGGLSGALNLAAAGEMDLAQAGETVANSLNLFKLEGSGAGHVADLLAQAANSTTAEVSHFAQALTQGGAAAKAAGASIDQTIVGLEALALAGVRGSDAGTSLKAALTQLASPTDKQAEATKSLSLEFFNAKGELKTFPAIAGMLRKSWGGLTKEQRLAAASTIAGTDGMRTLLALYDAGPQKLQKITAAHKEQGTAQEVAAKKQDNLKGKFENFMGSVETAAITVGEQMLPALSEGFVDLTDEVNKMAAKGDFKKIGEGLADGITWIIGAMPEAVSAVQAFVDVIAFIAPIVKTAFTGLVEVVKPQVLFFLKLAEVFVEGIEMLATAANKIPKVNIDTSGLDAAGDKLDDIQAMIKGKPTRAQKIELEVKGVEKAMGVLGVIQAIRVKPKVLKILATKKDADAKVEALKKLDLPDKLQKILGSNRDAKLKIAQVIDALAGVPSTKTVTISVEKKIKQITQVSKIVDDAVAPSRRKKSAGGGTLGDQVGISGFSAGADLIALGGKRKEKPVRGVHPVTGDIEFHTPSEWKRIRDNASSKRKKAQIRKRAVSSTSVFDVRRARSDLDIARAEGTLGPADDLTAIGAREKILKGRLKTVGGKLKGKLSREARARLLGESASLTGELTGLGARRGELTAPAAVAGVERMNVAKARLTGGLEDDSAAAQALVEALRREFGAVNVPGADPAKVEAAADALASASGELDSVAQAMKDAADRAREEARQRETDSIDAGVAMARLTETLDDDIAAQRSAAALAQTRLSEAMASGNMADVATFANALADANQAIQDLTDATRANTEAQAEQIDLLRQQLDDTRRSASGDAAQARALIRGLTDQINGNLGQRVGVGSRVPPAGRVGSL